MYSDCCLQLPGPEIKSQTLNYRLYGLGLFTGWGPCSSSVTWGIESLCSFPRKYFFLHKNNACLLKTKDKEITQSATIQTNFHYGDVDIFSSLAKRAGIFILFFETLFSPLLRTVITCFEESIFTDDLQLVLWKKSEDPTCDSHLSILVLSIKLHILSNKCLLNFCGLKRVPFSAVDTHGHPSLLARDRADSLFMASLHLAFILALFPGTPSRIFSFGRSLLCPKASLMLRTYIFKEQTPGQPRSPSRWALGPQPSLAGRLSEACRWSLPPPASPTRLFSALWVLPLWPLPPGPPEAAAGYPQTFLLRLRVNLTFQHPPWLATFSPLCVRPSGAAWFLPAPACCSQASCWPLPFACHSCFSSLLPSSAIVSLHLICSPSPHSLGQLVHSRGFIGPLPTHQWSQISVSSPPTNLRPVYHTACWCLPAFRHSPR